MPYCRSAASSESANTSIRPQASQIAWWWCSPLGSAGRSMSWRNWLRVGPVRGRVDLTGDGSNLEATIRARRPRIAGSTLGEPLAYETSYIDLDPTYVDQYGVPVARVQRQAKQNESLLRRAVEQDLLTVYENLVAITRQIEELRIAVDAAKLCKKLEPTPSVPRYILTEPWVGYRFATGNEGGGSLVYISDNELSPTAKYEGSAGWHQELVAFVQGARVLIHDTTYTVEEYDHHRGWGHSTYIDAVELALNTWPIDESYVEGTGQGVIEDVTRVEVIEDAQ